MESKMKTLNNTEIQAIQEQAKRARAAILTMTTLANSGHPGGSMSCIDILLTLYHSIRHNPKEPHWIERDRVVVSNGHISPAVYSALGLNSYFDLEDCIAEYRLAGSMFEGHIERYVPGVEWTTGNLGQGLSAGCGFALASRINKIPYNVFVLMGDGEQQKGQVSEARRFAVKYNLSNLTAVVDYNRLQISGNICDVMPQNIRHNWESDGWKVLEINGHDIEQIAGALHSAIHDNKPVMILAHTVMGKDVPFMENQCKYHGAAISEEQYQEALNYLSSDFELSKYKNIRKKKKEQGCIVKPALPSFSPKYETGISPQYEKDCDNRSAWGNAIADLAQMNLQYPQPIVVFDCDLQGSVKTTDFEKVLPDNFIQGGIMEQNTAVTAGTMSICGIQTFWADFGIFGIDEVYNNQRLNDINHTNLKIITTHVGMDVGEDGRTHQCIDYIGLIRNLFHFGLLCPADANQTDKIIRWLINQAGNYVICMGRSKLPVIRQQDGSLFYGESYMFHYGKADLLREGKEGTVIVTGTPVGNALKAVDILKSEGISVQLWFVSAPLIPDIEMLIQAVKTKLLVTVEDHNVHSGLGSIIADRMVEAGLSCRLIKLGAKEYPISGSSSDVYQWAGLDVSTICDTIRKALKQTKENLD